MSQDIAAPPGLGNEDESPVGYTTRPIASAARSHVYGILIGFFQEKNYVSRLRLETTPSTILYIIAPS